MGQLGGSSGLDRARLIWVGALLGPLSVDGSAGADWSWVASAGHFHCAAGQLRLAPTVVAESQKWNQKPEAS